MWHKHFFDQSLLHLNEHKAGVGLELQRCVQPWRSGSSMIMVLILGAGEC